MLTRGTREGVSQRGGGESGTVGSGQTNRRAALSLGFASSRYSVMRTNVPPVDQATSTWVTGTKKFQFIIKRLVPMHSHGHLNTISFVSSSLSGLRQLCDRFRFLQDRTSYQTTTLSYTNGGFFRGAATQKVQATATPATAAVVVGPSSDFSQRWQSGERRHRYPCQCAFRSARSLPRRPIRLCCSRQCS